MTGSAARRHLVGVWNPGYARSAMEEHLTVLLTLAGRLDQGDVNEDDLYVWWGKVRSPNRQQPQANMDEIRALAREISDDEETHVYLTDYRSLYVGELAEITEKDPGPSESEHVPGYYRADDLKCDFWFKLYDIRRLVTDDMLAVIAELRKLRNVFYNDRPVSIFGGMVDLPLVVTRSDGQRFFDPAERDAITDGKLWAEFDAQNGAGVAAIERTLRDDLLGEATWSALSPGARTFVATAEKLFRDHRNDPAFDYSAVVNGFAKAIEVECNAVLRNVLPRIPAKKRLVNLDRRTVDLLDQLPAELGVLAKAIGGERELNEALGAALEAGRWFTGQLPAILEDLRKVRNRGSHSARVDQRTATAWRNRILGIGGMGDLVELAKVRPRP